MNLSISDLAPVVVAGVATAVNLILVWLAVRQAHSGRKAARHKGRRADPTPAE
jgi:hypothetical protein